MLKIFQRWARVKEVFISRRRNRWGRQFGFVRFFHVPNESKLEKELDQIFIGNMKLYVNLPKYRRSEYSQHAGSLLVGDKGKNQRNHGNVQSKEEEEWREVKRRDARKDHTARYSYADVVRKSPQNKWKGPCIETTSKILPWMSTSAVGRMVSDLDFVSLSEEFIKGGMSMIKVRYLGDNFVLLTPREGERMEDIIKLNKSWFTSVFEDLEPWSASFVVSHRLVWARCYGLPLSLWNKDCLSKIIGEMEDLISIDEATEQWENLEYVRIQLRVIKTSRIGITNGYWINGEIYNISIFEEEFDLGGRACRYQEPIYSSSDNISSSDTFIEETGFSDKASEGGHIAAGGTFRQGEEDEGDNEKTSHVKSSQLRKISQYERGRQSKDSLPYINKIIREQGVLILGQLYMYKRKSTLYAPFYTMLYLT